LTTKRSEQNPFLLAEKNDKKLKVSVSNNTGRRPGDSGIVVLVKPQ
jgi:hypothetical protein